MNNESTSASIWLVALGILVTAIGFLVSSGSDRAGASSGQLGIGLITVGGLLFGLGLLIEFFSIGSSLRQLVRLARGPSPVPDAVNNDVPARSSSGPAQN